MQKSAKLSKTMQIIANQCKKSSRAVTQDDAKRVREDALAMLFLCHTPLGRYRAAFAIAHCQVDHDDPLRFFVMKDGSLIVNPKIKAFSDELVRDTEGCMSHAFRSEVSVKRFSSVKISYQTLSKKNKLSKPKMQTFTDLQARIFQHEIDHFNGKSIYS